MRLYDEQLYRIYAIYATENNPTIPSAMVYFFRGRSI